MDEFTLMKLRKQFESYCERKYYNHMNAEEIEDIVSWASIQWLQGRHEKTNYQYIVADYFRMKKHHRTANTKAFDYFNEGDEYIKPENVLKFPESLNQINGYLKRSDKTNKSQLEKMITGLVYKYGFQNKEIADLLDVTESRISKRLREIFEDVQETLSESEKARPKSSGARKISFQELVQKTKQDLSLFSYREMEKIKSFEMASFNAASF